jgi:hypothetical protein
MGVDNMDLFTLAFAKSISGGGGGSVTVPDHLIQYSIFSYHSDTNKYEWDTTPSKLAESPLPIPIYHDKTRGRYLLPCQTDLDEYADYTYVDTSTGTIYYLAFHFDTDDITINEKQYQLTDEIIF